MNKQAAACVASLFERYRVLPHVSLWHLQKHMHTFPAGRGVHNDWEGGAVGVLIEARYKSGSCSKTSREVE
jgi:hypothetical protein